jgi:hypothetical protein
MSMQKALFSAWMILGYVHSQIVLKNCFLWSEEKLFEYTIHPKWECWW